MHHAITLEALRVLDAIDRKGSFGAAAESLFKVTSAVSYTVQKLEADLGTSLFDRSKQRASLTPAGNFLLTQGRHLLDSASAIEEAIHQLESGWEVKLRIALDAILPVKPFYDLVNKFWELQKQVEIAYSEEVFGGTWDALINGRCDLSVGAAGEPPKGQLEFLYLGDVRFIFAVAKHHPLCSVGEEINSSHLKEYPAVISADSSLTAPTREAGLFESKQTLRVPNLAAKIAAQKTGVGVGFLPHHLVVDDLETGELVALKCSIPRPDMPIYAAWRKSGKTGKALGWFIDEIRAAPTQFGFGE